MLLQNPSHAYAGVGSFSWTMTASVGGATCSKSGTVTVTGASTSARRRVVNPPSEPGSSTEVLVQPSPSAQTFTSGDLSVTVPGGLLTAPKALRITKLESAPSPNFKAQRLGGAYAVTLGDLRTFDQPLVIRMKYDATALRADLAVERAVSVAYYDTGQGVWVEVPGKIDQTKHEIVFGTNHLTTWGWFMWGLGYPVIEGSNFTLVYDKVELDDPYLGPVYNAPDKANHVDPNVPDYIEDAFAYLNIAFHRYKAAGFKVPPTPINVYVGGGDASQRAKFFGHGLTINLNSLTQSLLKMETAHELFHSFEGAYLTAIGMGTGELPGIGWAPPVLSWSVWYIEGAAEYAAEHMAWDGTLHLMGKAIRRDYLSYPLSDVSANHDYGYATAHFIAYLVDHGANFKAMSEYLFNYDWLNGNDYYYPMHEYLELTLGSGKGLPRQYQTFARYYIFDANSPMPALGDSLHSEVAAYRTTMTANPQESVTFDLTGGYTAKLWGIGLSDFLFDANTPSVKYTVAVDGTIPAKVEIDVWVLNGDRRVAGGGTPIGTLTQITKAVEVEASKGDVIYVLAVSSDSTSRQVKVNISSPMGGFGVKYSMTLLAEDAQTACWWGTDPVNFKNTTESISSLVWTGTSFEGSFNGDDPYGGKKHLEVSGQLSADMKKVVSVTYTSVGKTEGNSPQAPSANSRVEVTTSWTLTNLPQTSKSADGKTLTYFAAGNDLKAYLTRATWDHVLEYYNIGVKYVCKRTIVDWASVEAPPAVEITLTQK